MAVDLPPPVWKGSRHEDTIPGVMCMIDRDTITSFIHSHRKILVASVAGVSAVLCLMLIVSAVFWHRAEKSRRDDSSARNATIVPPELFFLPPEPLRIPDVQLSRETPPAWPEDEAARWYVPPSTDDVEELRVVGERTVETLLEIIP